MAPGRLTGQEGETIAARYLEDAGYLIVERNFRWKRTETDLIALDGKTLVFVEVKTRSNLAFGAPEDFVNAAKRKQLAAAAEAYTETAKQTGEIRFDIIAITVSPDGSYHVNHIKDAFWPGHYD